MNKVYKSDGKFFLEPSPAYLARVKSEQDKDKVKGALTDADLQALLERILIRLEALEK